MVKKSKNILNRENIVLALTILGLVLTCVFNYLNSLDIKRQINGLQGIADTISVQVKQNQIRQMKQIRYELDQNKNLCRLLEDKQNVLTGGTPFTKFSTSAYSLGNIPYPLIEDKPAGDLCASLYYGFNYMNTIIEIFNKDKYSNAEQMRTDLNYFSKELFKANALCEKAMDLLIPMIDGDLAKMEKQ